MSRRHQDEQTSDCSFPRSVFLFSTRNHWKFLVPFFCPSSILPYATPLAIVRATYQHSTSVEWHSVLSAPRHEQPPFRLLANSFADTINKFENRGFARSIDCKPFHLINSFPNVEKFYGWIVTFSWIVTPLDEGPFELVKDAWPFYFFLYFCFYFPPLFCW